MKVNPYLGELEITMFEQFCAGQRIRTLIREPGLPESLSRLQAAFSQTFDHDGRGSLLNDILASDTDAPFEYLNKTTPSFLDDDIYDLIRQCRASSPEERHLVLRQPVLLQTKLSRQGVTFSPYTTSIGNSYIIYGNYHDGNWSAGRISSVFILAAGRGPSGTLLQLPYLVVEPFKRLSPSEKWHNPYQLFSAAGKLFRHDFDAPILLQATDAICHFAGTPLALNSSGDMFIHVLPLDRVRNTSFGLGLSNPLSRTKAKDLA